MYLIDENTSIDETLITCAEYQLFIDEKRSQGEYRQPDHWIFYQFPAGQARTPIVGVRFSDAKAFCEWLTQREAGKWSFRLPTSAEAEQCPLTELARSPLGYWTVGQDDEVQFAWVGVPTINPRALTLDLVSALDFGLYNHRAIDSNPLFRNSRSHARARNINRSRASAHALEITRALDLALARPLNLFCSLNIAISRTRTLNLFNALNPTRDLGLTRDLDRAIYLVHDINRKFDFSNDIALDQDRAIARSLYIDICTLQERIAGSSPAFEGIRIVKKRISS
jgi:hypothetical protein